MGYSANQGVLLKGTWTTTLVEQVHRMRAVVGRRRRSCEDVAYEGTGVGQVFARSSTARRINSTSGRTLVLRQEHIKQAGQRELVERERGFEGRSEAGEEPVQTRSKDKKTRCLQGGK